MLTGGRKKVTEDASGSRGQQNPAEPAGLDARVRLGVGKDTIIDAMGPQDERAHGPHPIPHGLNKQSFKSRSSE